MKHITNLHAISRVRSYFPNITKVVDAKTPILVTVTKEDARKGTVKDPSKCAMAQACMRSEKADGAIINLSTSYIIKGDVAYRYKTCETVAREICSYDRHKDFAEGVNYRLSAPAKSQRLGFKNHGGKRGPHLTTAKRWKVHRTVHVRNIK